jgi:hypothetical protein
MSGWIAGSDRKRLWAPSTAGRYKRMVSYATLARLPVGRRRLRVANTLGRGRAYRDVGEGFRSAAQRSGISAARRLSLRSMRQVFASL